MISAILLSGGVGKRLGAEKPKQYLPLHGKPMILHSLEALLQYPFWLEIAIVCEEAYQPLFLPYQKKARIIFAPPGKERQNSVFSAMKVLSKQTKLVCIHDGARPLLSKKDLLCVLEEGKKSAASLAVRVKTTIKEADSNLVVKKTLDRTHLWDLQTPQVLPYEMIQRGYQFLEKNPAHITDDVMIAEMLNYPVQLVEGSSSNIKITTSEDLLLAEILLKRMWGHD